MATELKSVFTDDMDHCYFTGSPYIERHHVWAGNAKKLCEKYGFIFPLRYDLHPNGVRADKNKAHDIDVKLKKMCQQYWLEHYGTKQEFIDIFQKRWLLD